MDGYILPKREPIQFPCRANSLELGVVENDVLCLLCCEWCRTSSAESISGTRFKMAGPVRTKSPLICPPF